ncbi:MAG: lysophospholipid acyltransferase family protein [Patescibacteria group bacterium]
MKNTFFHLVPLFVQTFLWLPVRLALEWFGRIKIEGLRNFKGYEGNVIFAVNHSNPLDPFIIPASLPMFSRYLPLFFATQRKGILWGGYPLVSDAYDYRISYKKHMKLADAGESFVLFLPEHGGVAFLADYAECPIIPVGVSGISSMSLRDFFDRKHKITVKFGKPIFQKELKGIVGENHRVGEDIYKKQAEYVMRKMEELVYN